MFSVSFHKTNSFKAAFFFNMADSFFTLKLINRRESPIAFQIRMICSTQNNNKCSIIGYITPSSPILPTNHNHKQFKLCIGGCIGHTNSCTYMGIAQSNMHIIISQNKLLKINKQTINMHTVYNYCMPVFLFIQVILFSYRYYSVLDIV